MSMIRCRSAMTETERNRYKTLDCHSVSAASRVWRRMRWDAVGCGGMRWDEARTRWGGLLPVSFALTEPALTPAMPPDSGESHPIHRVLIAGRIARIAENGVGVREFRRLWRRVGGPTKSGPVQFPAASN
jgi:hypothetical protein